MIDTNTFQNVFGKFELGQDIVEYQLIQETSDIYDEKLIYFVKNSENKCYVCRYYYGGHYSESVIEQQSNFAMTLYKNGIITPLKYKHNGHYCIKILINNKMYLVTLEDYLLGQSFEMSPQLFGKLGRLLGKLHSISENNPTKINYSIIDDGFKSGTAKFDKILNKAVKPIIKNETIYQISKTHDGLVNELMKEWWMLPKGSVNGDLSVFNNIIDVNHEIGIIDFDLAGNETYLGDMLITFYSSLYQCFTVSEKYLHQIQEISKQYFDEYCSQRKLTEIELSIFSKTAALFDGLYFCKMIVDEWNYTQNESILKKIDEAHRYFDVSLHDFISVRESSYIYN